LCNIDFDRRIDRAIIIYAMKRSGVCRFSASGTVSTSILDEKPRIRESVEALKRAGIKIAKKVSDKGRFAVERKNFTQQVPLL